MDTAEIICCVCKTRLGCWVKVQRKECTDCSLEKCPEMSAISHSYCVACVEIERAKLTEPLY